MGEYSNNFQKSRRGFFRLAITTSLLALPAFLVRKNAFANDGIKLSNEPNRRLTMAKKVILEFKVKKLKFRVSASPQKRKII